MSGARYTQGWTESAIAAEALDQNLLVDLDTAGKAKLCAANMKPIGSIQISPFASGANASIVRWLGKHAVKISAAVAKGDQVVSTGSGKVGPDGTSGSTVTTAYTIGVAATAGSNDGDIIDVIAK